MTMCVGPSGGRDRTGKLKAGCSLLPTLKSSSVTKPCAEDVPISSAMISHIWPIVSFSCSSIRRLFRGRTISNVAPDFLLQKPMKKSSTDHQIVK